MKNLLWMIITILLIAGLWSCRPASPTPQPTTPTQESIKTSCPTTAPTLSQTTIPRWVTYQKALAMKMLGSTDALCEFELLGVSESRREVYIWALCEVNGPHGAGGSGPAVVHLTANGEIEKIDIPISGINYPKDIERLFPPDIAERAIHMDLLGYASEDYLRARETVSVPPLMIVAGTPLP